MSEDLVLAAIHRSAGEAVKFAGDQARADREAGLECKRTPSELVATS